MKVFDLECAHAHVFEGWFASEADFQNQLAQRLLVCPMCSDADIRRRLSAPRLNLGASASEPQAANAQANAQEIGKESAKESMQTDSGRDVQMQGRWMAALRHLVANTEDVGERFAHEARRMHHGKAPERGIRGQASAEESRALREEGIEVLQLPVPDFAKEPLQ